MIHIYKSRKKKRMISRLKSPLSFNSLKWKFYVDIVSTGQQCLVETKGGTARILQRGGDGGTKSDRNSPTSKMVLSAARN